MTFCFPLVLAMIWMEILPDRVFNAIEKYGNPEIVKSDQGSQFTSVLWTKCLDNENIKIRIDAKRRAIDNIFKKAFVEL